MQGIRTINGQYPNDNRDLTLTAGAGISITPETAGLKITNISAGAAIAGDNIEITPSGDDQVIGLVSDPVINGDLQVNGDIIQNGSAYETHAEKVYTTNDYIITRDGAISALSAGDYSGFQVKKYDGTNDGRLVIDNGGVARVGDVGDEQPLLTRSESASLTNTHLLQWDGTNQKAVDAGFSYNDIDDAFDTKVNKTQYNLDMAGKVSGSGNIGSDTKPIKVVGGVATAVTNDLMKSNYSVTVNTVNGCDIATEKCGNIMILSTQNSDPTAAGDFLIASGILRPQGLVPIIGGDGTSKGYLYADGNGNVYARFTATGNIDIGFRATYLISQ